MLDADRILSCGVLVLSLSLVLILTNVTLRSIYSVVNVCATERKVILSAPALTGVQIKVVLTQKGYIK